MKETIMNTGDFINNSACDSIVNWAEPSLKSSLESKLVRNALAAFDKIETQPVPDKLHEDVCGEEK